MSKLIIRESEYRRLVKRDRNWKSGLVSRLPINPLSIQADIVQAQKVTVYQGHKDHVTCLKLVGEMLISGSSDGT